jgi:hypothetical protein
VLGTESLSYKTVYIIPSEKDPFMQLTSIYVMLVLDMFKIRLHLSILSNMP